MDAIRYYPEDVEKIGEMTEEKLIRVRTPLELVSLLQQEDVN